MNNKNYATCTNVHKIECKYWVTYKQKLKNLLIKIVNDQIVTYNQGTSHNFPFKTSKLRLNKTQKKTSK